ncbi:ribonuclease P protein component [Candidatus Berkelbacteria bacterium]|nr:ribonuclease P protein component [Candidatus Berkelbacteria bacterium]
MLPRPLRLTKTKDFDRLYQQGDRRTSHFFTLRVRPNQQPRPRLAVVMSTKISKRATVRNQHKRQTRVVLAAMANRLAGWDILITIRHCVTDRKAWGIFREELRTLLKQRFGE